MTNTIINNINADIISKANEANKAETERIVNTYQQMWGNGDSFIANDMAFLFGGAQRSGLNDDEEMAAAVKAAETDLIYKVIHQDLVQGYEPRRCCCYLQQAFW